MFFLATLRRIKRKIVSLGTLSDKLDELAHNISKLDRDISKLDRDISKLDRDMSKLNPDISKLDRDVSKLDRDISKLNPDISKLDRNVSNLDRDISKLDRDISKFIGAQTRSETRLEAMEKKIIKLAERSDARTSKIFEQSKAYIKMTEVNHFKQLTAQSLLQKRLGEEIEIPSLRGYAISPDFSLLLLDLLEHYKPKTIADFGSGASTIILGDYAKKNNASVVSIDHDRKYLLQTKAFAQRNNIESRITFVQADVTSQPTLFYDKSKIPLNKKFDFVVLDGPPQVFSSTVRGNLLPLFCDSLAKGCIIVMDDFYREGERAVVENWRLENFVEIVSIEEYLEKQAAILRLK